MKLILLALLLQPSHLFRPPPRQLSRSRLRAEPDEAPGTVIGSAALVAGTDELASGVAESASRSPSE